MLLIEEFGGLIPWNLLQEFRKKKPLKLVMY